MEPTGTPDPTAEPTAESSPAATIAPTPYIPAGLISADHFAYIKGYEDGGFRPDNNMTRAEAAVMFARLMKDAMPDDYKAKGVFTDVKVNKTDDAWFIKEVEYLASKGIIKGYNDAPDGDYFNPRGLITRAEFATIASRFGDLATGSATFPDISGHWAKEYIISAAAHGWIKGYEDGGFRPENKINRAEVVTMVNRMLGRVFDEGAKDMKGLKTPPDVLGTSFKWAYNDILEAMNGHNFNRKSDGKEEWTGLK